MTDWTPEMLSKAICDKRMRERGITMMCECISRCDMDANYAEARLLIDAEKTDGLLTKSAP